MTLKDNTHYWEYGTAGYTSGSVARVGDDLINTSTDYYSTGAVCGEMGLLSQTKHKVKFTCQTDVQVCEIKRI
jgi:hypothetical protein